MDCSIGGLPGPSRSSHRAVRVGGVYPQNCLRRLGGFNIQIDRDGLAIAAA